MPIFINASGGIGGLGVLARSFLGAADGRLVTRAPVLACPEPMSHVGWKGVSNGTGMHEGYCCGRGIVRVG